MYCSQNWINVLGKWEDWWLKKGGRGARRDTGTWVYFAPGAAGPRPGQREKRKKSAGIIRCLESEIQAMKSCRCRESVFLDSQLSDSLQMGGKHIRINPRSRKSFQVPDFTKSSSSLHAQSSGSSIIFFHISAWQLMHFFQNSSGFIWVT